MPNLVMVEYRHGAVRMFVCILGFSSLFLFGCVGRPEGENSYTNAARQDSRMQFILHKLEKGLSRGVVEKALGAASPTRHGGWVFEVQPGLTTIVWYDLDDTVCSIWLILGSGQVLETRDDPASVCPGANGS